MIQAGFQFGLTWISAYRQVIQESDNLSIVFTVCNRLAEGISFTFQLIVNKWTIEKLNRHTQI